MLDFIAQLRIISLETFIQVYIVQGSLFLFFLFMAYKILHRNKSRVSIMLGLFYISVALGFSMNFIFTLFQNEFIVKILYFLTLFFLFLGTIFLTLFTMMLNGQIMLKVFHQNLIILIYSILLFLTFFIPNGLKINESTDWHPVYSDFFIISLLTILTVSFLPTLYFSIRNSKMFQNPMLKRKWLFFIVGILLLYFFAYGTLIIYKFTLGNILLIWSIISLILIIISALFIYYGIDNQGRIQIKNAHNQIHKYWSGELLKS